MLVNIADAGHLRKKLTLSYSPDEVRSRRSQVLRQLGGEMQMNGFRKGKTATSVVEQRFGAMATSKTEEQLFDEGVNRALKDHQLKPVGPIQNDSIARTDGLTMVLTFDVKPAIELPVPTALGIAEPAVEVTDAEVEERYDGLRRGLGSNQPLAADQGIAVDDVIALDGAITAGDGAQIRALTAFQHLVGSIPLFGVPAEAVVAALAGKKIGDALRFDTTLPETYPTAEHRGKPAVIQAILASAKRTTPQSHEEVAKTYRLTGPEQMRTSLKEQILRQRQAKHRQELIGTMMEKLAEQVTVELPAKLLEDATAATVGAATKQATDAGADTAALETAVAEAKAKVPKDLKRFLIIDAIIETRKIGVTRQDIEDQIRMASMQTGRPAEEIAKRLKESGQIQQVVQEIREAKAIETFLEEALGRDPAATVAPSPAHGEPGHVHGPDCQH
jgi:trigger factor